MHSPPMTISHGALTTASASPAAAANPKHTSAAVSTDRGVANRDPTSRSGPARTSSVPRMPSE